MSREVLDTEDEMFYEKEGLRYSLGCGIPVLLVVLSLELFPLLCLDYFEAAARRREGKAVLYAFAGIMCFWMHVYHIIGIGYTWRQLWRVQPDVRKQAIAWAVIVPLLYALVWVVFAFCR